MAGELQQVLQELAGLRESQRGLGREVGELKQTNRLLTEQIGEAQRSNERIAAKLDAFLDRTRDEMQTLFLARNEHETRLSGIERDYVSQAACNRNNASLAAAANKLEQRVEQQAGTVSGLQRTEAKAGAIASVVSLVVSVVAGWVGRIWWH
jgi:chromosome segregation ATPase